MEDRTDWMITKSAVLEGLFMLIVMGGIMMMAVYWAYLDDVVRLGIIISWPVMGCVVLTKHAWWVMMEMKQRWSFWRTCSPFFTVQYYVLAFLFWPIPGWMVHSYNEGDPRIINGREGEWFILPQHQIPPRVWIMDWIKSGKPMRVIVLVGIPVFLILAVLVLRLQNSN